MFTNHATGSRHPASCLKQVVCPALELLTFNAIIFYVAAPVSAALLFLSLFFVERKQETPTVTIVGDRSNATSGCVVFSLLHANTNCLQDSKILGTESSTFILHAENLCTILWSLDMQHLILLSKSPM